MKRRLTSAFLAMAFLCPAIGAGAAPASPSASTSAYQSMPDDPRAIRVSARGGESAVLGRDGNTYVANGQVFVYAPDGTEVARIDVPERPLQLVFGGEDGRTLFILTHRALYSAQR